MPSRSMPDSAAAPQTNPHQRQTVFERMVTIAAIVATVWLGTVTMFGAWVPPSEFDVVEYHLQAPKEFTETGRIEFVPHNVYANMPLGAEMHALAMMTLTGRQPWLGGLIGKSITAAISLLGAVCLGAWVAQRLGSFSGWTAAGLWLGTPGITHVATQGLIDGVLATYVFTTALITWQAIVADKSQLRMWALAFLLAGASAALKYPGLIFGTLPCLAAGSVVTWQWVRARQAPRAGRLIACALFGLALTCLPWYAKNWWLAGNPVYPLAANVFGGRTLTPEKIAQWQAAHRVPSAAPAEAGLPRQLFGQVQQLGKDVGRVTLTSSFVQPAMIFGLVCAGVWLVRHGRVVLAANRQNSVRSSKRVGSSWSGRYGSWRCGGWRLIASIASGYRLRDCGQPWGLGVYGICASEQPLWRKPCCFRACSMQC